MRRSQRQGPYFLVLLPLLLGACATTEEQVRDQIEVLAANELGSEGWQAGVDELVLLGRPGARQLVALLDPGQYRGVKYREFRDEIERTRTGAAVVLGRIRHRAASGSMDDRIGAAYTDAERHAALRAVGDLGFTPAAVNAITAQLADEDPQIRLLAAVALLKMGEDAAVDTIRQAVAGADDKAAALAIGELEGANYYGVPLLVEMRDSIPARRPRLQQALQVVGAQLVAQLLEDDPEIRRESAQALGAIGDPAAAASLAALLEDASNLVRFAAATSLARMQDERGTDFLFRGLDAEDPIQRLNAVRSLIEVQTLSGGIEPHLKTSLAAASPRLRSAAAQILGQARVDGAVEDLLAAAADVNPEVRWSVVISLGRLGAAESRSTLRSLVDDDDSTVSYYARWALKQLGAS